MIEFVRMVQLNSILDVAHLKMWNYLQMTMDADFELLSYGAKLHEGVESDEDYQNCIAGNTNVIFHRDGYSTDCFDSNDEMALDVG